MSTSTFPPLRRRPARVLPSVVVTVVALAVVVVVAWAGIERATQGQWPAWTGNSAALAADTPITDPAVLTAGILLGVLGLVLLMCSIIPGGHSRSQLRVDDSLYTGVQDTVLTHHGLAQALEAPVSRVDGVRSVTAQVKARKANVHVETPLRDNAQVKADAREVAEAALQQLPLVKHPAVTVSVQHKKG